MASGLSGHLLSIFPPFVVLMIFFSSVTGLFINPEFVDFTEPFLILAYVTVLMILRFISGMNIFYYVGAALVFLNGFVMLMHWLMLGGPLTVTSLFVVFNSNFEEAVSFFELKNSLSFLLLIPFVLLFLLSLRYTFSSRSVSIKQKLLLTGLAGVFFLLFVGIRVSRDGVRAGTPLMARSSILFYKEIQAFQQLKQKTPERISKIIADVTPTNRPQVYVVIQGESANRRHHSLYGYQRNTNPLLSTFDSLLVFSNVVSAYTMTLESISAQFTEAGLENNNKAYNSLSIMDVMNAAGVKTFWLSNQSPLGVWDNVVTLLAQQSDITRFVNVSGNDSNDALSKSSYDSKLFVPFAAALEDTASIKFIVLHLIGSHATYSKRYPPEYDVFHGNSPKEDIIAAYDNSIRYTDFVVDSLLKILKDYSSHNSAVSAAVYLSDHGENVYDDGDYAGHDYVGSITKSIVEIPFMIWLSPDYRHFFKERSAVIESRIHTPFVTDDFYHSMLDLSGINSELIDARKSLFNAVFDTTRKRILADGEDYDLK